MPPFNLLQLRIKQALSVLLLIFALVFGLVGLSDPAFAGYMIPESDYVTSWENKIAPMKDMLPDDLGSIGYISDATIQPDQPASDDYIEYYLTQYSLAPIFVQRSIEFDWIIVNSQHPDMQIWLDKSIGSYTLQEIGGGLFLLERQK